MSVRNRQLDELLKSFSEEILGDQETLAKELTKLAQKHPVKLAASSCNSCYGKGFEGYLLGHSEGNKTFTEDDYTKKKIRKQKLVCKCVYKTIEQCLKLKHPKS